VKPASAIFVLVAMAAATAAIAQTAPETQPQPEPATQPSEPRTGKADKQALIKDCMTQAQASNPSASKKDIRRQCAKQVTQELKGQPSPQN
jgi:hypothetical protein